MVGPIAPKWFRRNKPTVGYCTEMDLSKRGGETAWEYFLKVVRGRGTPLPSSEPRRSDLGKNYRKPRLDYQLYIINMIINQDIQ